MRTGSAWRRYAGLVVVAAVVLVVGRSTAQASTGDPVVAGATNLADRTTFLQTSHGEGLIVGTTDSSPSNPALEGSANAGDGVSGFSGSLNGVTGQSQSAAASGVYGFDNFGGYGVAGRATNNGVAVLADSADGTGTALRTTGKLEFQNRSGTATVASGLKSVKVTLSGVAATSMVMATVQKSGGFFASAVPAAGSFTIYLNKAPVSPATVSIAYLVLN